jgi:hypothetical protein
MARNMLKCVLTGAERITNNSYLKKRLDSLGITEDKFRKYYISRVAVGNLADAVRADGVDRVATSITSSEEYTYSPNDVVRMLTYNGKNRILLESLDGKYFNSVTVSTTTDECDSVTDTVTSVTGEGTAPE